MFVVAENDYKVSPIFQLKWAVCGGECREIMNW